MVAAYTSDFLLARLSPLDLEFTTNKIILSMACLIFSSMLFLNSRMRNLLKFAWSCFIKPFTGSDSLEQQQKNLERFYSSQANVYDSTREILLKGRDTALELAMAHVSRKNDLVWVDIGGGTGLNIEKMNSLYPIDKHFKAVFLVDLSPSLCGIARARFERLKLRNVFVICGDACNFEIGYKYADLITFSYSLSMIPTYHSAIDHAIAILHKDGVVASVDFGVQSESTSIGRISLFGGMTGRHIPWLYRQFWRIWFEYDKVFLDPARRDYLEYRCGTVKSLNQYNKSLGYIPYYIWIGCHKSKAAPLLHRINALATESPYLAPKSSGNRVAASPNGTVDAATVVSKGFEIARVNESKLLPYPSIFYQREVWRVYYDELNPQYKVFKDQYIYAFTWEDPREDARILQLSSNDTVLAITSAGDNLLSYASLADPPRRIHGVDLNPAQGHLAELKLACLRACSHEELWRIFGEGKCDDFMSILVNKLSSHLSSNAFQYWFRKGPKTFSGAGLYHTGFSRWGIKLAKYLFMSLGLTDYVKQMTSATDIATQRAIWESKIRPALFNAFVGKLLIGNNFFLWEALGVPANQAKMIKPSIYQYIIDTLDPIIGRSLLSTDNYFYYLTLLGHYSKNNCPDYLTKKGYSRLHCKEGSPLDNIRLHTDTLKDVFSRLSSNSLTVAVIMDHMDWFDPDGDDANSEIEALANALPVGGRVLLRSASTHPWYMKNFERYGFECEPAAIRQSGESIDRINMYASTWLCRKVTPRGSSDITKRGSISSLRI